MAEILAELSKYPVKTRLSLTGPLVVARDIAHAKIKERLDAGEEMPAVPARPRRLLRRPGQDARGLRVRLVRPDHRRPDGLLRRAVPGRRRLDGDAGQGQPLASRSPTPATRTAASTSARSAARPPGSPRTASSTVEVLEYAELGMEAVWKIEVEDFPAFIVVDDKGNDFFAETLKPAGHEHQHEAGAVSAPAGRRPGGGPCRPRGHARRRRGRELAAGNAAVRQRRRTRHPNQDARPPPRCLGPAASAPSRSSSAAPTPGSPRRSSSTWASATSSSIRTAGHVVDTGVLGSLEFGVGVLDIPLIVVLGHDSCGAVGRQMEAVDTGVLPGGYLRDIVERVTPSVLTAHRGRPHLRRGDRERARPRTPSGCSIERSTLIADRIRRRAAGDRRRARTTSTRDAPAWSTRSATSASRSSGRHRRGRHHRGRRHHRAGGQAGGLSS